jgi:hypothetical protein
MTARLRQRGFILATGYLGRPSPLDPETKALLHAEGANGSTTLLDETGSAWSRTGSPVISTAQSRYGSSSVYFDGTSGGYFSRTATADFGFGTGDFTVEFSVYPTDTTANRVAIDFRSADVAEWLNIGRSSGGVLRCYDGTTVRTGAALPINTWSDIAWVRSGTSNTLYVNGTSSITFTNGGTVGATRQCVIGANANPTLERWLGHIDEIRISKGLARYSTTYTPGPFST